MKTFWLSNFLLIKIYRKYNKDLFAKFISKKGFAGKKWLRIEVVLPY